MDDAWMFLRYAKHWLDGQGFSWNPEDGASYGATSVLYLFIITTLRGLSDWPDAHLLGRTSFAFGLLSCLVLVYLGFLLNRNRDVKRYWLPLLIIPNLLLIPAFGYHCLSGMETTLSLLMNSLLACFVVVWSDRRSSSSFIFCIFLGYLSFLARPDSGLLALLFPPLYFAATERKLWRYSIQYAAFFILILGLDLCLKQFLLGSFLPFSFYAKGNGFYRGYLGISKWNAVSEMILFWNMVLPSVILLILLSNRKVFARLVAIGIPVVLTFGYHATVIQIMGYNARYYCPFLPFFIMAAFLALSPQREEVIHAVTSHSLLVVRASMIFMALLPALFTPIGNKAAHWWQSKIIDRPTAFHAQRQYIKPSTKDLPELGWSNGVIQMISLLKHMPPDIVVAASEHGIIGAEFPELTIIDILGLHDRYIAYHGFSAEYLLARKPDIIWFPHSDYSYEIAAILDNDIFALDYDFYPGAYDYGIAVRTTSPVFSNIQFVLNEEFIRVYPGLKLADYRAEAIISYDD